MYDYVKCNYCDYEGTVAIGADECPKCHTVGMLQWVEGHEKEVEFEEVKE